MPEGRRRYARSGRTRSLSGKLLLKQVSVMPDELDQKVYLFNCSNGTIDLLTNTLRPHDPMDVLTRIAPTKLGDKSRCPRWMAFLTQITGGDEDMINYLQCTAGYALTGTVSEHCVFFLHGVGRNGKGVFLNTLLHIVGEYGKTIPSNLFIASERQSHPTGLTDLEGARLVVSSEIERGRRWDESLLKTLSGGGQIRSRCLYENFYEFSPTHKIFFAANDRPEVQGTDVGIWSRIKLIPFGVVINSVRHAVCALN